MRALLRRGHRQRARASWACDGYGIDAGCTADLVLLQARDPVEAIRLRAQRLWVMRRGRIVARTPAGHAPASNCPVARPASTGRDAADRRHGPPR